MGRPTKSESKKAKNAGFSAFPEEIAALKKIAKAEKLRSPFDYVRQVVREKDHPFGRGKITAPRAAQNQSSTPSPVRAPSTRRLVQV